jgi:hypothetical protein
LPLTKSESIRKAAEQGLSIDNLPEAPGVYAFDHELATSIQNDHAERGDRIFSGNVFFIIRGKDIISKIASTTAFLTDWKTIGENKLEKIPLTVNRPGNQSDIAYVIPKSQLTLGIYGLNIGVDEYVVNIETLSIEGYWNKVLIERPNSWQAHNHLGSLLFFGAS